MSTTASLSQKPLTRVKLFAIINDVIVGSWALFIIPIIGICCFLLLWSVAANNINTSLGKFPGPAAVWEQFGNLYQEHRAERIKEDAFYVRQEKRNAKRLETDPSYVAKIRSYTGKETFLDQIITC